MNGAVLLNLQIMLTRKIDPNKAVLMVIDE